MFWMRLASSGVGGGALGAVRRLAAPVAHPQHPMTLTAGDRPRPRPDQAAPHLQRRRRAVRPVQPVHRGGLRPLLPAAMHAGRVLLHVRGVHGALRVQRAESSWGGEHQHLFHVAGAYLFVGAVDGRSLVRPSRHLPTFLASASVQRSADMFLLISATNDLPVTTTTGNGFLECS